MFDFFKKNKSNTSPVLPSNSRGELQFSKDEFIDLYLRGILSNFIQKIIEPYKSESSLFSYGQGSSQALSILFYTSRIKDVLLDAFLSETGSHCVRLLEGEKNPFFLSVPNLKKEDKTVKIAGIDKEFDKVYSFSKGLANLEIVKLAIEMVYSNYSALFRALKNSESLLLKKSGFNHFFQGASPEATDTFKEESLKQLESILNGNVAIVDKEDEFGTFSVEVKALQESVDFARNEIAIFLGIPKNELTGEQYTNTLGSQGAENIDERKATKRYNWIRKNILEPFLAFMEVKYEILPLSIDEVLATITSLNQAVAGSQNEPTKKTLNELSEKILKGVE